MDLTRLKYFIAVAEELNFTKAARRLHISQPPLSQQIKKLEDELRYPLFYRTSQKVELTSAGAILLREAKVLLTQATNIEQIFRQSPLNATVRLSIGLIYSALLGLGPMLLSWIRKECPQIVPDVNEIQSGNQYHAIESRRIDLGIMRSAQVRKGFKQLPLCQEQLLIALPKSHTLAKQPKLKLNDVAEEEFVLYSRHVAPTEFDAITTSCTQAGFSPNIRYETEGGNTNLALVAAGYGVTLIAEMGAQAHPDISIREFTPPLLASPLSAVWREPTPEAMPEQLLNQLPRIASTALEQSRQNRRKSENILRRDFG